MEKHTLTNLQLLNKLLLRPKLPSLFRRIVAVFFLSIMILFNQNIFASELLQPIPDDFQPKSEKSAAKAMLMSAIFPGAGQFYVSPSQWTAYVFPVIEVALFCAMFHYTKKGDDKTREYEKFADENYSRAFQYWTQWDLVRRHLDENGNTLSGYIYNNGDWPNWGDSGHHWGNGSYFRLEYENTQHFYEDIGKYEKYIFGWHDWFDTYVEGKGPDVIVNWKFNEYSNLSEKRWIGNYPNGDSEHWDAPYSPMCAQYIQMRRNAEVHYANSRKMRYFLLLNHALAVVDANRVARKYNKEHSATQVKEYGFRVNPNVSTTMVNDNMVPILGVNVRF